MISNTAKLAFLSSTVPALALIATTASAATVGAFTDGDFNFGSRHLGPNELTVSLQAVAEKRDDGTEYRSCTLATFKEGVMSAVPGEMYDAQVEASMTPQEAIQSLRSEIVPRSSYRGDAQYIVVSVSPEGDDFVRINGGAPLVEDGSSLFIGDVEIPAEHISYEQSSRYGTDRAPESYTLFINDPATVANIADAIAGQEQVQAIVRTVNSDFIIPLTFQGNTDLRDEFAACLEDVDDMTIPMGTFPSWQLGNFINTSLTDVETLAAMFEDEAALANPENFQIANILSTEGMFAISSLALQEMMNGEVLTTSIGEYQSYDHSTGIMTVSPDMLDFETNLWNSCSCGLDFGRPGTPTFTTFIPGDPGRETYTSIFTGGGYQGGGTFTSHGGGGYNDHETFEPAVVFAPVIGALGLGGAIAVTFGLFGRKEKSSAEIGQEISNNIHLEA